MADELGRLNAEQAVLGAMLMDPGCAASVLPRLREDDFSVEHNRAVFRAVQGAQLAGKPWDALTVAEALKQDPAMRGYIAQLVEITATSATAEEYAEIVSSNGKTRRLREAIHEAAQQMDEHQGDAIVLGTLETAIRDYNDASAKDVLSPVEQATGFYQYRADLKAGKSVYTRTGFRALDRLLNGGLFNAVYFLAARPGTGKTAFALNVAEYVAAHVGPVVFHSMEMSREQIMARRLALEMRKPEGSKRTAPIDSGVLLTQKLFPEEWDEMAAASARLAERPLYLCDRRMDVQKALAVARGCKGCRLLVIDHFTLFKLPGKDKDYAELREVSHALMEYAKGVGVPVLCLIQLNRDNEKHGGAPRLGELRGSGGTEEDAGGVMFLHKYAPQKGEAEDEGQTEDGEKIAGEPEKVYLTLAKNRFGRGGEIKFLFYGEKQKFVSAYW